jgi:hypothetical protein
VLKILSAVKAMAGQAAPSTMKMANGSEFETNFLVLEFASTTNENQYVD